MMKNDTLARAFAEMWICANLKLTIDESKVLPTVISMVAEKEKVSVKTIIQRCFDNGEKLRIYFAETCKKIVKENDIEEWAKEKGIELPDIRKRN